MSNSKNKNFLGEYVHFQNGYAFKSSEYTDKGHYLIRIKNVQQGFIEINDECFVNVPNEFKYEKFKLKSGDIVVSLTGNVGRIAKIGVQHLPAVLNQRVASITPRDDKVLSKEYLYYLLRSPEFFNFAIGTGKGAAQQNISTSDMEKFEAYIPSFERQQEIVNKLDSAFTEIDLLERNLDQYFEKINILIQSIQDEELSSSEKDWVHIKLGDLGKWITGSTPSTSNKDFWGDEVPFVTPADLGIGGELGNIKRSISKLGAGQARLVNGPSLLLVCIGATLGKVAWTDRTITTNQQINALQVDPEKSSPKFLMYLLSSPKIQNLLWETSKGTTLPIINKTTLENIAVDLPTVETQIKLVEKFDNYYSEIELIRSQIISKKDLAKSLRETLLTMAFLPEEEVA